MQKGNVAIEFFLHRDGTITDAQVTESSVTERFVEICRRAVLDSAPFPSWPENMEGPVDKDHRKLRIHFYFEK